MSWYNPLSWGDKVVDNVLDKDNGLLTQFGGFIGNLNLTEEELIKLNISTVESVQVFVKETLSENTERSKTRRSIATMWIKMVIWIVLFTCLAAPFNSELALFYLNLLSSNLIFGVTTAISIFFFGSHGLARLKK